MLLYIMNVIYKIHYTCNIDRILSDEAASLLVERSIASINKNRLYHIIFIFNMQSLDEQVDCFDQLA